MNSSRLRILFICAWNKQRSVTAERIYENDSRLEVRSAGVRAEAKRRVSDDDLVWADAVFVMEPDHGLWISMRFDDLKLPPIEVLDIPDRFRAMDHELQGILRALLDPRIERLLASERGGPTRDR